MRYSQRGASTINAGEGLLRCGVRFAMLIFILLALGIGVSAQLPVPGPAPLSRVLPGDTAFVITGDATWWWGNFATVRDKPAVSTALATTELLLGTSLEKDVLPCVGQIGFAFLDIKDNVPNMLLLLEIRDQAAFAKVLPTLQTRIETLTKLKWTAIIHAGVPLRYADLSENAPTGAPTVSWGQYGGWLVVGMGRGTVRRSIDAWKGTTPALADNAKWMDTLAKLPDKPGLLFGINGDGYVKFMKAALASLPAGGPAFPYALYEGMIMLGSLQESDQGLRLEEDGSFGPAIQQHYQTLTHAIIPVDGKALAQLPPGTFAAMLLTNPGQWAALDQSLLHTAIDANTLKKFEDMLQISPDIEKQLTPVLALLDNLSGQSAIAASWTEEAKFGLTLVGETPSAEKATAMAAQVTNVIKTALPQFPLTVQGGITCMPEIPLGDALFSPKFCWTAQDAWFKCASDPRLLTGAGQTTLQLPPQAAGADSVLLADLGFLTPFLTQLEDHNGKSDWIDALRSMELAKLQLVGYYTFPDDGASMKAIIEFNHLSGKGVVDDISLLVKMLMANMPSAVDNAAFKPQQTASEKNLRQLALDVQLFAQDHGELLPPITTAADLKTVLKVEDDVCLQPSSKQSYLPNAKLAGQPIAKYAGKEADTILFYEQSPYPDGSRCVAYLDGHVEVLSAKDWGDAKAKLGM